MQLSFDYHICKSKNAIALQYTTLIPHSIDFLRNKIIHENKSVYSLELTVNGSIKKDYCLKYNDKIFAQMEKKLVRYITMYKYFKIPHHSGRAISLEKIKSFLENKHLMDIGFYRWKKIKNKTLKDIAINNALELIANHRKEKSVRRAFYAICLNRMNQKYVFEPSYLDIFMKTIEDPNILVKFLELDIVDSLNPFKDREKLYKPLVFLKQHYTEKQILNLLSLKDNVENLFL
ncbi:MAG: hypothetical protein L0Y61_08655, partial [Epsilonproteobacteria bacterium]|nr:hypothetical protein [Campylobacterota bacterium]